MRDDDAKEDDALDMGIAPCQQGLTKEEHEYVVNSLLASLEEGKVSSAEQAPEEYEYYGPEGEPRLRHGLWYVPFVRSGAVSFDVHPHS